MNPNSKAQLSASFLDNLKNYVFTLEHHRVEVVVVPIAIAILAEVL